MFLLWKIIFLINVLTTIVVSQFENQYLGNYVTLDQYNDLEVGCQTKLCLSDAQRLLLAATQNKTVLPCDDFKEFSMGEFIRLRARHERYEHVGFFNDANLLHWERNRKVLAATIKEDDIRPFKIAKNLYQNCINSDNVRENGASEFIQYLTSLGGAKLLNSSWDGQDFDLKKLFENESHHSVALFLLHHVQQCPDPRDTSKSIICLKTVLPLNFKADELKAIIHMFKVLKLDTKLLETVAEEFDEMMFRLTRIYIGYNSPAIYTVVSSLNKDTNSDLNWVKIINVQLTSDSAVTGDTKILVEDPTLIGELLKFINLFPKEPLANAFAFKQLHRFKSLFIVYAFDELEKKVEGTEKSKQRWEQCLGLLFNNFAPVVQSLYASKYYDMDIQKSAKDFTNEVVQDYIAEISDEADEDIIEKLNSIDYVIGFPKEVFNHKKIAEFYDELELDGTEGFVASFLEMENYDQKIRNNPSSDWKRKLQALCIQYDNKYFTEYNILYVPPMFWLVVAHLGYTKGHNQDMDPVHQLVLDFFHVIYKEKPEFREAFKCSEMTDEEQEVYEDMLEIRSYFG